MTSNEVVEFLRGDGAGSEGAPPTLAFDTNTLFGDNPKRDPGIELINTINRANELRGDAPLIRLVVPAVVFHEKIRQMMARRGDRFDLQIPLGFLRTSKLEVEAFTDLHAVEVARRLQTRYRSRDEWGGFKKRRCLECLGLPPDTQVKRDGHACGATVDWLIAGHAQAMGYLLVTNDTGPEFEGIALRASLTEALGAADALLAARSSSDAR